jgi:hypothetical protein
MILAVTNRQDNHQESHVGHHSTYVSLIQCSSFTPVDAMTAFLRNRSHFQHCYYTFLKPQSKDWQRELRETSSGQDGPGLSRYLEVKLMGVMTAVPTILR